MSRKLVIPAVIVLVVLGSMFSGLATATEAAALGTVAALFSILIMRRFTWEGLLKSSLATVKTTTFIMFIVASAKLFGWVLSYFLIPQHFVEMVKELVANPWVIIILIQLGFVIIGMFMDTISIMVITVPILLPLVISLGFDPIWFGVLFLLNAEMGVITPPVAFNLYVIKAISPPHVKLGDIARGCLIFCIADVAVLALVMIIPQLALWLPEMMMR